MESLNSVLINEGLPQSERLLKLKCSRSHFNCEYSMLATEPGSIFCANGSSINNAYVRLP